ncbi:hypothetical protein NQZ68_002574 [Dissostichus eleginoides]|nr:hypothetical protein NQZ68_002574 [Dissostichus eleginoides]
MQSSSLHAKHFPLILTVWPLPDYNQCNQDASVSAHRGQHTSHCPACSNSPFVANTVKRNITFRGFPINMTSTFCRTTDDCITTNSTPRRHMQLRDVNHVSTTDNAMSNSLAPQARVPYNPSCSSRISVPPPPDLFAAVWCTSPGLFGDGSRGVRCQFVR